MQSDPAVTASAGGVTIRLPLSHQYPFFHQLHPRYSDNLTVVARLVGDIRPGGTAIDIGANVGDSSALIKCGAPQMPILCIDGDPQYIPYLRRNTAIWPDVQIAAPILLGATTGEAVGKIRSRQGTSHVDTECDDRVSLMCLDELLESMHDFNRPALIKSDTDGFEEQILRGAEATLRRSQPVLFIEYDPSMLARTQGDGLGLLSWLGHLGYHHAAFYDHLGHLLVRCTLNDRHLLSDLDAYVADQTSPVAYYDLVLSAPQDRAVIDRLADSSIRV